MDAGLIYGIIGVEFSKIALQKKESLAHMSGRCQLVGGLLMSDFNEKIFWLLVRVQSRSTPTFQSVNIL